MALNDENNGGIGATMLVGPTGFGGNYGGYPMAYPVMYGNNGGMGFGGDWGSLIVLFLIAAMFGGFGGGFGMGGFGGFGGGLGYDFPWLLNGQNGINNNVSDGFRTSQLQDSVTSVRDGVSNLATQLCNCCGDIQMGIAGVNQNISSATAGIQNSLCQGFAGTIAAVTNAQNAVTQQLYNNEIASLNRSFAEQTANAQGFNGVQSGLCDIRYGNATNTRDILTALTAGVQSIKDQLCQDKIDAKNDEISQLRQEVLYARGQASQVSQNGTIINGVYDRLSQCPVGTVPVFGNQPIFTCPTNVNSGCGCGCNGSNF